MLSAILVSCLAALLRQMLVDQPFSVLSTIQWFLIILCLQSTLTLFWNIFIYPFWFSPYRHLPQAPQSRSWRTLLQEPTGDDCLEYMQTVPNDGLIRYFGLFNGERLLLTSVESMTDLLQTNPYSYIKTPGVRKILVMLLGDGLVVSEGAKHKFQRKNLMPAFSFRRIKELYPVFWSKASQWVQSLEREVRELAHDNGSKEPSAILDITERTSRVTLDIVCVAGFGHDPNVIDHPDSEWFAHYRLGFVPSKSARRLRLLALTLPGVLLDYLPMKRVRDIQVAQTAVKARLKEVLASKRDSEAKGQNEGANDMASIALRSGAFREPDLLDQSMTMLAAGHETTSGALAWAVYELCKHPDMQSRLRAEIRAKLPSPSAPTQMTADLLDSLPYLRAICTEVLRLHSPIPILHRVAAHPTSLRGTPLPIKKGTHLRISPWAIGQSPTFWGASALTFSPDRWLSSASGDNASKGGADSNYAFMAFGHGARSCIGASFAKAEFAACLAGLVGRFGLELQEGRYAEGLRVEHGLTVKIDGGLCVRLRVLDGW